MAGHGIVGTRHRSFGGTAVADDGHGTVGPGGVTTPPQAPRRSRRALLTVVAVAGTAVAALALVGAGRLGYALGTGLEHPATTSSGDDPNAVLYWTPDRMRHAGQDQVGSQTGQSPSASPSAPVLRVTTPPPAPDRSWSSDDPPPVAAAVAEARPYATREVRIEGRVFARTGPSTTISCSGTVVRSPGNDLVWTAAHCVHGGRGQGFYHDIVFVPAYGSGGAGSAPATLSPLGVWTVRSVSVAPEWTAAGDSSHSKADYAALVVAPRADGARLADVLGTAAPILFDAPRHLPISAYGYPAVPPYSGTDLYRCDSPSQDYPEFDEPGPDLVWIGCTLAPGASGGGWFATVGGTAYLVSNFSMYSADSRHYGPYLDDGARSVYDTAVAQGG